MSQSNLVLYASHRLPVARNGMADWIRKTPLFEYAELDIYDGEQALLAILRHQPQLAILDINLPKMPAMEIVETLQRHHSETRIILWGDGNEMLNISQVKIQSYSLSLLTFADDKENLMHCLDAFRKQENYISKSYYEAMERSEGHQTSPLKKRFAHVAIQKLTTREMKVMQLISGGKSTNDIADQLCLSHRTIDSYRMKIAKKLNLKGKNTLLLYAHENKDVWKCL